jgi:HD-like signal output (HDOD) protein
MSLDGGYMTKQVLIVDDERTILREIEKQLIDVSFTCMYAHDYEEAVEYLRINEFDMIISDIGIKNKEGLELLGYVKKNHPKTIRVALCHISENRRISKLIEKGYATEYIFKPWDGKRLKSTISHILEMEQRLLDEKTLGRINKLDELPSLPHLYHELTDLIEKDADIMEVANLISRDQAITLKILKLANSAFYGRKTGSINQAIMTMGLNNVRNIVLTNSIFKEASESMNNLWQHTIDTNRLCLAIYDRCLNKRIPSLYSSAGLLHDVGQVILYMFHEEEYLQLQKLAVEVDEPIVNIELSHFSSTHQDIGAFLLNSWGLPYAYVEAAMFHHQPMDERIVNQELVAVIHIADYYSSELLSPDGRHKTLDPRVFGRLNITREQVEQVVNSLE